MSVLDGNDLLLIQREDQAYAVEWDTVINDIKAEQGSVPPGVNDGDVLMWHAATSEWQVTNRVYELPKGGSDLVAVFPEGETRSIVAPVPPGIRDNDTLRWNGNVLAWEPTERFY